MKKLIAVLFIAYIVLLAGAPVLADTAITSTAWQTNSEIEPHGSNRSKQFRR